MIDPTPARSRALTRTTSASKRTLATLALLATLAFGAACAAPPCKCVEARCPTDPASMSPDASEAPSAPGPSGVAPQGPTPSALVPQGPTPSALVPQGPRGVEARDLINALFARDFGAVRSRLTVELGQDLTDAKLGDIVTGLVQAHGPAMQLIDAWTTTIKEKEVVMPAASATVLMANDVRVGLLLVYDEQGMIKGLWLRPI